MRSRFYKIALLVTLIANGSGFSQVPVQRFPRPQFESGYQQPATSTPAARPQALDLLDVAVLLITLSLASYFSIYKRSRFSLFLLMLFSLLYFGFWRKGCICPVGSLQNVALAFFDSSYIIPWSVVLFFTLPLIFSLFFGRAFCAAVCPLGALQDLFTIKPMQTPAWLERGLRILPYLYLGLVVLYVGTGTTFLICRFDPFVGFFRMHADAEMVLFGLLFLGLGVFVSRPYCRYLCPYGVLLSWTSRLSRKNVTITPNECIQCRLCEQACPFGAINLPTAPSAASPETRKKNRRRIGLLLVLLPIMIGAAAWLGSRLQVPLSRLHPTVLLAEEIYLQDNGKLSIETLESKAFRSSGKPTEHLFAEAKTVQKKFATAGSWFGAFFALILGLKLLKLYRIDLQKDYLADKSHCLSCGRCFATCPVEIDRRLQLRTGAEKQKWWDWL